MSDLFLSLQRCQCASLRLVDNEQFLMGQALKTYNGSLLKSLKHALENLYVTKWKNFKVGILWYCKIVHFIILVIKKNIYILFQPSNLRKDFYDKIL